MIYDLFPTAIGHYNFARAFSKDELDFFYNQVSRPNVGNRTSKSYFLLQEKSLHNIKLFLEQSLKSYTLETIANFLYHNHGVIIHPKANIIININMQILLFQAYSIFKQNLKEII